ncbi:COX23 [Candida jiufengensis]|uniref:COX23 n=1 Tax=Candida jiufengensis TaxID=497108 RepID=UPI0022240902|nr:COX23 [Candida jiufengensis]KAI5950784.1 COX23 [Candida jiufengensis]
MTEEQPVNNAAKDLSTNGNNIFNDKKLGTDEVEKNKSKVNFTNGGVENYKFYPDQPENHRHKYRWAMKEPSKFYDPCEESRMASMDCLYRNQDDKYVCQDFFDAYRECRKDFFRKKKADKLEGKKGWGW